MKFKKILAMIAAITITISMSGCMSFNEFLYGKSKPDSSTESISDESTDESSSDDDNIVTASLLDEIKESIDLLDKASSKEGNDEEVRELTDRLLGLYDKSMDELAHSTIDFYYNFGNEEYENVYDKIYEDCCVASEFLGYAFCTAYDHGLYDDILEDLVTPEDIEYFLTGGLSIKRLEALARRSFKDEDARLDEYYDLLLGDDMSNSEKELVAAELYLNILKEYDTETFYSDFNRDYTGEDIIALGDSITTNLIALNDRMTSALRSDPKLANLIKDTFEDDPVEVLTRYAGEINEDFGRSAEILYSEKLYTLADNDDCFDGSFCVELPTDHRALMYLYRNETYDDMLGAIHEFGHFNSMLYDDIPVYLAADNIDIAEIQSQGMEVLFTQKYDEIFGDSAETMKMYNLYAMVNAALSAYLIGSFEYEVLCQCDDLSAQDVVDMFNDKMKMNDYELKIYDVNHIFEQPGYYISYCVSALAALNIWVYVQSDYDRALEMYDKISHVNYNDKNVQFSQTLRECGFANVLSEKFISGFSAAALDYVKKFEKR